MIHTTLCLAAIITMQSGSDEATDANAAAPEAKNAQTVDGGPVLSGTCRN